MKTSQMFCATSLGALVIALSTARVFASLEAADTKSTSADVEESTKAVALSDDSRLAMLLKKASLSQGVNEVAQMASLGTDSSILIAHVQASDIPYKLRPEDVAYLNEHNVPDSVIAAMIVQGAEVRARTARAPAPVAQQLQVQSACIAPKVVFVPAPCRLVTQPISTVTVIGGSYPSRGLSYRSYYYSPRNFFSGTYGRVYSQHGSYSYYGPSYRRSHIHRSYW